MWRLSFVDPLRGSRAVQTSSGNDVSWTGGSVGASMKHPQQGWLTLCRDHWHAMSAITLTTGMQCLPSPWCWGEGLNWGHRPLRVHLNQSLNVKKTCDQRWRRVWGCGSPRVPCLHDPHSHHVPSSLRREDGRPRTPKWGPCALRSVDLPWAISYGGREAAQLSGEGGLLGKAKACFQGANCIYSWIHMNFKMLLGICT